MKYYMLCVEEQVHMEGELEGIMEEVMLAVTMAMELAEELHMLQRQVEL